MGLKKGLFTDGCKKSAQSATQTIQKSMENVLVFSVIFA